MRRARGPLTGRDRQVVKDFEAFLNNELAIRSSTGEFVDPALAGTDPDVAMAGRPEVERPAGE